MRVLLSQWTATKRMQFKNEQNLVMVWYSYHTRYHTKLGVEPRDDVGSFCGDQVCANDDENK